MSLQIAEDPKFVTQKNFVHLLLCLSFILSIFASNLLTCLLVHLSTYHVTLSFYYLVFLSKQLVNLSTRKFVTQKNFVHLLLCLLFTLSTSNLLTCLLVHLSTYYVFYLSCPCPEKTLHSHIQITLKSIQNPTSRATLQPTENQIVINPQSKRGLIGLQKGVSKRLKGHL